MPAFLLVRPAGIFNYFLSENPIRVYYVQRDKEKVMKQKVLFFLLFSILAASNLFSEPIRIAVTEIEALGVKPETAAMVTSFLQSEFSRTPLFHVVERGKLDQILAEHKLQLSGITGAQSAAKTGNILEVQKVIFGSISRYESKYVKYLVSLRLVDVERAAVETAATVEVRDDGELLEKITGLARQLSEEVELIGRITLLEENLVYTSLGSEAGIAPGDTLSASTVDFVRDEMGQVVMREEKGIANILVEEISPEGSRCRILESNGSLEPGMTVRIGAVKIQVKSDKSALDVKSEPENARVYLDSTFLGITPLSVGGIEPGTYDLEIRSGEGYKAYKGRLTLKPGRSFSMEKELEQDSPSPPWRTS